MGTDIHTAAEFRRDGRWQFAGAVFDSGHDWHYERCTREALEALSDGRLVDAFDFYVLDDKYGHLRDRVTDGVVRACEDFKARRAALQREVEAARERSRNDPRGWDYYRDVKPVEMACMRVLYEATRLDPRDRASLTDAALALHEERVVEAMRDEGVTREEAEVEWGLDVRLTRVEGDPPFKTHEPFDARCYDLFAALADVRNGAGFAGVDTGDPIVPVAPPRGRPDDADPETLRKLSDEHTPSWLTLAELKAYDWDRPKTSRGIVSGDLYEVMRELGTTCPWGDDVKARCTELRAEGQQLDVEVCGGISGDGIRVFTEAGYEAWKQADRPGVREPERRDIFAPDPILESRDVATLPRGETDIKPFVKVAWSRPLRDSIADEFFESWPALEALVPDDGSEDDVRVVFDFDS